MARSTENNLLSTINKLRRIKADLRQFAPENYITYCAQMEGKVGDGYLERKAAEFRMCVHTLIKNNGCDRNAAEYTVAAIQECNLVRSFMTVGEEADADEMGEFIAFLLDMLYDNMRDVVLNASEETQFAFYSLLIDRSHFFADVIKEIGALSVLENVGIALCSPMTSIAEIADISSVTGRDLSDDDFYKYSFDDGSIPNVSEVIEEEYFDRIDDEFECDGECATCEYGPGCEDLDEDDFDDWCDDECAECVEFIEGRCPGYYGTHDEDDDEADDEEAEDAESDTDDIVRELEIHYVVGGLNIQKAVSESICHDLADAMDEILKKHGIDNVRRVFSESGTEERCYAAPSDEADRDATGNEKAATQTEETADTTSAD